MLRITAIVLTTLFGTGYLCAQSASSRFARDIRPLLDRACVDCHAADDPEAGLDLESYSGSLSLDRFPIILKLRNRVLSGEMPPPEPGAEGLRPEELNAMSEWAKRALAEAAASLEASPGRVTLRRLSREEYDNTVRDVFGVRSDRSASFPTDDLGYGFDNIGDALSFSLLHLEKYAAAAEEIAARVISIDDPDNPEVRRFEAENMDISLGERARASDGAHLFSNGDVSQRLSLPRDGVYRLRVMAYGRQAGREKARMSVAVDANPGEEIEVPETRDAPGIKEVELAMKGGDRLVSVGFVNDYYRPEAPPGDRDRNLFVDWVELVGPVDRHEPSAGERWMLGRDRGKGRLSQRLKPVLKELVIRAWRRPASSPEINRLSKLVKQAVDDGESIRQGLRYALEAVLVSPHFLFRVEPGGLRGKKEAEDLRDWALASRLSYFLWSSAPDGRLRSQASKRKLRGREALRAEAKRMLIDPRSSALAENFAAQWLELKNLADATPDPDRFPSFDRELAKSMRRESELFFDHVLRKRLGVYELLRADYSFVDSRLAKHYGIEAVKGDGHQLTRFDDPRRGGLLGQAAVHTITSNATRTSPVKRGKWLLENILDAAPPPPPPGADALEDEAAIDSAASLRDQLAAHRADPDCASCHNRMDALGFAMEHFDAVGRDRRSEKGQAVDASSVLPNGRRLEGPADLRAIVGRDPAFLRAVAKKLFIYAVGRDLEISDEIVIESMLENLGADPTLEDLILGIIDLDAFRRRRVGR